MTDLADRQIAELRAELARVTAERDANGPIHPVKVKPLVWTKEMAIDGSPKWAADHYEIYVRFIKGEGEMFIVGNSLARFRLRADAIARCQAKHNARILSALEPATDAQCCMCGKKGLSTIEGDGGTECELSDGRWTCSSDCWEAAQPDAQTRLVAAAYEAAARVVWSPKSIGGGRYRSLLEERAEAIRRLTLADALKVLEQQSWQGPGETPHRYSPDYMAMGDCRICGHPRSLSFSDA